MQMNKRFVVHWGWLAILLCGLLALAVPLVARGLPAAAQNGTGGDLLPNLVVVAPRSLSITMAGSAKRLFFTNEIMDIDTAPLELAPQTFSGADTDDCNGNGDPTDDRLVYQRIYQDVGNDGVYRRGQDTSYRDVPAGCMLFHPAHNHFHFDDFSAYRVQNLSGVTVAEGGKQSTCLRDDNMRKTDLPGAPTTGYFPDCTAQVTPQGISVGWSDVYYSTLPDQYIDVSAVADGEYCLLSIVDPNNRLLETNKNDNSNGTRFRLTGTSMSLTSGTCPNVHAAAPPTQSAVYDDSLLWQNWSWGTTVNPSTSSPVFSGFRSMSVQFTSAWAGLALGTPSGFNTTPFNQLHMAIRLNTGQSLSGLSLQLYDGADSPLTAVSPASYVSGSSGGWSIINVPLSALNGSNKSIGRVVIQDDTGAAQPTFYVDELWFINTSAPPPPPPPTPTSPPPTATPTSAPGSTYYVYDDSLGWSNWSWRTTVNPSATSPVASGTRSMAVTYSAAWAGLALAANSSFNSTGYNTLRFSINRPGAQPLSSIAVSLYDGSDTELRDVDPTPYATVASGGWYNVVIPLSALDGVNKGIARIQMQENRGIAEPTFYIDNLGFQGAAPLSTPTPGPTTVPTATPTPTGTVAPTAAPTPTPTPTPGAPRTVSVIVSVASGPDDAYAAVNPGWPGYSNSSNGVYVGAPGSDGPVVTGYRWTGLNIPAGAVIQEAYVEFNQQGSGHNITTRLAFERAAAAAPFSAFSTPAGRMNTTTTGVYWSAGGQMGSGQWVRTPSLVDGMQQLVSAFGGLNQAVLLEDGRGVPQGYYHMWNSYEGGSSAPRLHLTYTTQ